VADWFDVDGLRTSPVRLMVVREVGRSAVVIGSTQSEAVVAPGDLPVVRRRSGGGAVLVSPEDPFWVDVWVPRSDPLWHPDVVHAARWVGEWWVAALSALGAQPLSVHRSGLVARPWSSLVCFAGVGPGEVLAGSRKVVGLAQWRGREGALFHTAAYRVWDPAPLIDALELAPGDRVAATAALTPAATGLTELLGRDVTREELEAQLVSHLPIGPWGRQLS
jgi:lipoate-protein ligase A